MMKLGSTTRSSLSVSEGYQLRTLHGDLFFECARGGSGPVTRSRKVRQLAYHVLNLHPWSPFHLLLLYATLGVVLVSTLIQLHRHPKVLPLQLDVRSGPVLLIVPRLDLARPMPTVFPQRLHLISVHPPTMFPSPL